MGGSEIDVSQIPLMTPDQERILGELLPKVMMGMQGFPLGQAYGGPSESSYGITKFGYPHAPGGEYEGGDNEAELAISDSKVSSGGGKGGPPTGIDKGPGGGRRGDDRTGPRGLGREGVQSKPGILGQALEPVLDVILGSQPQTNIPNVQTPESQPISPIQQALTQPIISPFTQGMTGNYPRQGSRRGG